jgi:UDP-N-acetylmuramate dehydrogenase
VAGGALGVPERVPPGGSRDLAIVNRGGSTADVLALAGEIEKQVYGKFGIRLRREPVVVRYKP